MSVKKNFDFEESKSDWDFKSNEEYMAYLEYAEEKKPVLEAKIAELEHELSAMKRLTSKKALPNLKVRPYMRIRKGTGIQEARGDSNYPVWNAMVDLAKNIFIGEDGKKMRYARQKISELPEQDYFLIISFLNEIIPIWNKYFVEANADLIEELGNNNEHERIYENIPGDPA